MSHVSARRSLMRGAYILSFIGYVTVGYWLQVRHGFILGDALSRVSAAKSVLFSRDPHLAAVGFVFTPLSAMLQIPTIALSPLWPALTARAFSGTLMSAAFMAGAVVQILGVGLDRSLPRRYAMAVAALFACNPMIVFYGSNGMSEAPFLFFVAWSVRRLIRWMVDDDVHHLVAAGGIAMGLAYLTRYDALACTAVVGVLVGATTFHRARSAPRVRRALLDTLIVSGPGVAAFLGWAAASWLITGEAFAQFTSQYGNAAILRHSGATTPGLVAGLSFATGCITLLVPALLPLAAAATVARRRRRNLSAVIVPIAIYGAALAFQALSYASGSTFGFLRFYITAIPLTATLAMLAVPDGAMVPATRPGRHAPAPSTAQFTVRPRHRRVAYLATAVVFAITVPASGHAMAQPHYAPQEYALGAVLAPDPDDTSARKATERRIAATFSTERRLAAYLDGLHLPDSSILADTVYGFAVVAASQRPKAFVVPSDPDFIALLNNPARHGIRYLLAVPKTGRGATDVLNQRYPTLYDTGAKVATLELEVPNDGDNQPNWRLYRVSAALPATNAPPAGQLARAR